MAATARVIWLCACVRYWPDRGLLFECVTYFYCCYNVICLPRYNEMLFFLWREENRRTRRKTSNKLYLNMTVGPGSEPESRWWEPAECYSTIPFHQSPSPILRNFQTVAWIWMDNSFSPENITQSVMVIWCTTAEICIAFINVCSTSPLAS